MPIDPAVLPPFLLAVTIIVALPGPDMAFVAASGVAGGRPGAIRAALGITTGVTVHVLVTAAGLGAVLARAPLALDLVRACGAAYLLVLGVRSWQAATPSIAPEVEDLRRFFGRGFVVNVTNPKIAVFFAAFLPQFTTPGHAATWLQLLVLGLVLQAMGLIVDLVVGLTAATLHRPLAAGGRTTTVPQRAAATIYVVLAIVVVVDTTIGLA